MTMTSGSSVRVAGLMLLAASLHVVAYAAELGANITADEVLARLKAGNERLVQW